MGILSRAAWHGASGGLCLTAGWLWLTVPASAQLSPGDLARPHEDLEGLTNCTTCHELGNRDNDDKCLSCHTAIGARLDADAGYHARLRREAVRRCAECHSDHNGREFELIHWPDGKDQFDHELTDYALHGKHAHLECGACHRPERIADDLRSIEPKLNLSRTYLGLPTNCLGCHEDEHRQQLDPLCTSCHTEDAWRPAERFDHAATVYPLTGRHASVKCSACHASLAGGSDPEDVFVQYTGLKHDQCTDCHKDPHRDRFGQNCRRCHNTGGWQQITQSEIDHDRTDYPLRGRHTTVACDRCHVPGDVLAAVRHERCTDCHADSHRGQFAGRPDGGACESCHQVQGFRPALFAIAEHADTRFPLEGAHLAQPCLACHTASRSDDDGDYRRYRFEDRRCRACHAGVHGDQFVKSEPVLTCEQCHGVQQWTLPDFDHAQRTTYPLEGAHRKVACMDCHTPQDVSGQMLIQYRQTPRRCEACHGGVRPAGDVGVDG